MALTDIVVVTTSGSSRTGAVNFSSSCLASKHLLPAFGQANTSIMQLCRYGILEMVYFGTGSMYLVQELMLVIMEYLNMMYQQAILLYQQKD